MPFIGLPVGVLHTNCYVVYDDNKQGVVIDPGDNAPHILDAIHEHGLHIHYILLTHVHFDHIMAVQQVQKDTGASLLIPLDDEDALCDAERSLMHFAGRDTNTFLKADRFLEDGDTVTAGDLTINVMHTPGHTPGSSCYVCGNLLLTGDTLFADSMGRTDFPGGDATAIRQSLKRLAAMEGDYTVLPGHGPQTTLSNEKRHNPYLQ